MPVQLLELVGQISDNDAKLAPVLIELQVVTCQFHVSCNILTHVDQAAAASVRPSSCPPPFTTVDTEDCDTYSTPHPPPHPHPIRHHGNRFLTSHRNSLTERMPKSSWRRLYNISRVWLRLPETTACTAPFFFNQIMQRCSCSSKSDKIKYLFPT